MSITGDGRFKIPEQEIWVKSVDKSLENTIKFLNPVIIKKYDWNSPPSYIGAGTSDAEWQIISPSQVPNTAKGVFLHLEYFAEFSLYSTSDIFRTFSLHFKFQGKNWGQLFRATGEGYAPAGLTKYYGVSQESTFLLPLSDKRFKYKIYWYSWKGDDFSLTTGGITLEALNYFIFLIGYI